MGATTIQSDFVLLLHAQLAALQAGDRDALDLPLLASEFESVAGRYRNEVQEHAEIIIGILMRTDWVYGDWTELKLHRDLLMGALDDSPSLLGSADLQVVAAYEHVHGSQSCTDCITGPKAPLGRLCKCCWILRVKPTAAILPLNRRKIPGSPGLNPFQKMKK